jgi:hypothetical protein
MGAFAPVNQRNLLEARQMKALSFSVHIPFCRPKPRLPWLS